MLALTFSLCYSQSSRIKRFVSLQHPLLLCRNFTSEISENHNDFTVNYLINSCGLSPEGAILTSKRTKLRSPERPDSALFFLRNHGFSQTQISKIVRSRPHVLNSDPDKTLLPKLEFFRSLGVSRECLAKVLERHPSLLSASLENRIVPTYNFLKSMVSEKIAVSIFKSVSRIFVEGHCKNVVPNIEILKESGMPQSCISLLLAHHPSTLMVKPEEIGKVVDEVKQMGFNLQISTSVMAIKALCGNNRPVWNRSLQVYKRWGWSEDVVLSAFRRHPCCMIVSEKKLMLAMEFLVNKMGWPSVMIAKAPGVMCYSLEKRFIPRCLVVKVLLLKGLIKGIENVSLGSVLVPVEKLFLERFILLHCTRKSDMYLIGTGADPRALMPSSGRFCYSSANLRLLCRHFSSKISENHDDFRVNYLIHSCGLSKKCNFSFQDGQAALSRKTRLRFVHSQKPSTLSNPDLEDRQGSLKSSLIRS